jgi:predicted peroxiredoxin
MAPARRGGVRLNSYLFIESRCDHESPDVSAALDLAARLSTAGHEVAVFLIQNAVAMAIQSVPVTNLLHNGVRVWVDDFSISVRGFDGARCLPEVRLGGAPDLVRLLMAPGMIPVWH